jgi:F0F1-type ATP synthase assembly protein I
MGVDATGRRDQTVEAGPAFARRNTMAKNLRRFPLERSMKALQDNVIRAGPAASASYTLIGALILLGGIGYAVDQWRGTSPWFLFGGLLLGMVVGFYELVKTAWPR